MLEWEMNLGLGVIVMGVSLRQRGLLSVKDLIEWLVVTFILVFVFRAFVAEAFEIPTGSMAPNLYGLHREQTCPVCGTEYAYGFSPMPGGEVAAPRELICPNCGHRSDKHAIDNPDNGDKIFVLKCPFDFGKTLRDVSPHGERRWWHVFKPRRWDVVVFKDPNDGTTNLIKRLIGLPGEVLEIIDGDIYTADPAELGATAEGRSVLDKLLQPGRPTEPPLLTADERSALDAALRIRRKIERAQQVLWLPVYHHDFLPVRKRELAGWRALGKVSGWNTQDRRLRFMPAREGDGRLDEIAFVRGGGEALWPADGFEPPGDRPVTDVYAYNGSREHGAWRDDLVNVSDLRLSCLLVPHNGSGQVSLSLSKRDDRFTAGFASDGKVRLTRSSVGRPKAQPRLLGEAQIVRFESGRPVRLAIANVDYRVSVWAEGRLLLQTTDEQYPVLSAGTSLAEYARHLRLDAVDSSPEIRIGAAGMQLEMWHVAIDRDVYYRTPGDRGQPFGWGVQGHPIYLRNQPERGIREYFCLGDNSPVSKDGRLWFEVGPHLIDRLARGEYQPGTVPADQMMGRAILVVWPSGFPLFQGRLRLVPNLGEMRLIR
jgi:signal peptidase I